MSNNLYYKPEELPVREPTLEERVSMLEQLIKTNTSKMDRMCALLEELCEPVRKANQKEKAEKEKEREIRERARLEDELLRESNQLTKQIDLHRSKKPPVYSDDYKIWSIESDKLYRRFEEIGRCLGWSIV